MTVLCEQCGSIQISLLELGRFKSLVIRLFAKRRFLCRRCGWKAWRNWTDSDLRRLQNYVTGGAELDPRLVVLDKHGDRATNQNISHETLSSVEKKFELGPFNLSSITGELPSNAPYNPSLTRARDRRIRWVVRRGRITEMTATIAITLLAVLCIVLMSNSPSCINRVGL
jgi:hypothetical protein